MKIAVPYENGEICSHLAQVKEFLIFDVVDDEIISTKTVKQTYANDPGALVEFLKKENVAVLLCDALPIPDDDRPTRNQHPGTRRRKRCSQRPRRRLLKRNASL